MHEGPKERKDWNVRSLEAQLANSQASSKELDEQLAEQ